MSGQNGDFGRRRPAAEPARSIARPTASAGGGMSPLVKQLGGIALGAALALVLVGVNAYSKKQMGKELDRHWGEQKFGISPPPDIRVRDEEAMRSAIQTCDIGPKGACK
jgi:hypothetical protein